MGSTSVNFFRKRRWSFNEPTQIIPILGLTTSRQYFFIITFCLALPAIFLHMMNIPLAVLSVSMGAFLGIQKQKIMSFEERCYHLIMFKIRNTSLNLKKTTNKKNKAKITMTKSRDTNQGVEKHIVRCPIKDIGEELVSFSATLRKNGFTLEDTKVEIYIDGVIVGSNTSDKNGEIAVYFLPIDYGVRYLKIIAENITKPIIEGTIQIYKE